MADLFAKFRRSLAALGLETEKDKWKYQVADYQEACALYLEEIDRVQTMLTDADALLKQNYAELVSEHVEAVNQMNEAFLITCTRKIRHSVLPGLSLMGMTPQTLEGMTDQAARTEEFWNQAMASEQERCFDTEVCEAGFVEQIVEGLRINCSELCKMRVKAEPSIRYLSEMQKQEKLTDYDLDETLELIDSCNRILLKCQEVQELYESE